jgi:formylglycine-generating enzyme required for sulfatase activity
MLRNQVRTMLRLPFSTMNKIARGESAELRQFLVDFFSRDELEMFCADYFREVYLDYEGSHAPKSVLAQRLIDYCHRRGFIPNLHAALQKERREPYQHRFSLLKFVRAPRPVRNLKKIFISYAHGDTELAHRFAWDLRRSGIPVWVAPESIQPGESWLSAIDRGLRECGVYVLLLSPTALKSRWVEGETAIALQLEHQGLIDIVPVKIKRCSLTGIFSFLSSYQTINSINRYDHGKDELLIRLGALRKTPSELGEKKPKRLKNAIEIALPIKIDLLRVKKNFFWMGSHPKNDLQSQPNEHPRHRVFVSDFYVSKYPITNRQYSAFAEATQRTLRMPAGKDDHPVVNVSWHDAKAFCDWLSAATGKHFDLPTEAEWEKAARSTDGRIFAWGNSFDPRKLNSYESGVNDTTPVAQHAPFGDSICGASDMCGNVWEWCADWFDEDEYATRKKQHTSDPRGPSHGVLKAQRGGAFSFTRDAARCAYRTGNPPHHRSNDFGFRVVMRL